MSTFNFVTAEYAVEWLKGAMETAYKAVKMPNATDSLQRLCSRFRTAKYMATLEGLYGDILTRIFEGDGHIFRVDFERNTMFVYNGRYYDEVSSPKEFLHTMLEMSLMKLDVNALVRDKIARDRSAFIWRMLTFGDRLAYRPLRRYVAFNNGIFDLREGKLRDFHTRYVPELVLDIDYVDASTHFSDCEKKYGREKNPCRLWDKFIGLKEGEGVIPNVQMREAFQSFVGAMLINRDEYKIEKFCILHGPGRNGKSVLVDAVKGVFGDSYFTGFTPKELCGETTASQSKRYEVNGKLMNVTGDLDNSDFSGGFFKRIISFDKDIMGKALYSNDYVKVRFPLMMCCANSIPDTSDDSIAYYERLLPIASTTKVWTEKDQDTSLTDKLMTSDARIYIFNWIYEGYKRVIKNKGVIPLGDDIRTAMTNIKKTSSSMRRWFNEECPFRVPRSDEEGVWLPASDFTQHYDRFCVYYNEKRETNKAFGAMLKDEGFKKKMLHGHTHYYCLRREEADYDA